MRNDVICLGYLANNPTVTDSTEDFQKFLFRHVHDDDATDHDGVFARPGDPATHPSSAPSR